MDGRGRALDTIFVERLWRTVKWDYLYLMRPETVEELEHGLHTFFTYYNTERPHQSLAYRTPAEVYGALTMITSVRRERNVAALVIVDFDSVSFTTLMCQESSI